MGWYHFCITIVFWLGQAVEQAGSFRCFFGWRLEERFCWQSYRNTSCPCWGTIEVGGVVSQIWPGSISSPRGDCLSIYAIQHWYSPNIFEKPSGVIEVRPFCFGADWSWWCGNEPPCHWMCETCIPSKTAIGSERAIDGGYGCCHGSVCVWQETTSTRKVRHWLLFDLHVHESTILWYDEFGGLHRWLHRFWRPSRRLCRSQGHTHQICIYPREKDNVSTYDSPALWGIRIRLVRRMAACKVGCSSPPWSWYASIPCIDKPRLVPCTCYSWCSSRLVTKNFADHGLSWCKGAVHRHTLVQGNNLVMDVEVWRDPGNKVSAGVPYYPKLRSDL